MHIGPGDARKLSWWEYNALVWGHQPPEDEEVEAPEPAAIANGADMLRNFGMVH